MPKLSSALVIEARRVARLQSRITRLNRDLRATKEELRTARRNLKKLAASTERDPFDQQPPMRVFGETV